jgi:hypothetical protein
MVQNETTENATLSKEEIAKRREEITNFYKENIKHLKVQKEYEELLRDVEKARVERIQAQMFMAQAYAAGNPEEEMDEAPEGEEPSEAAKEFAAAAAESKRTLKRN